MKYKKIKKNSEITYMYKGLLFKSKYVSRQKHSKNGEWIYIFQDNIGGLSPIFTKDIQIIFRGK